MKNKNKILHEEAVKFWTSIPWECRDTDIALQFKRTVAGVSANRKRYAPHTLKFRKNWKGKIQKLINGELNYIVARNFVEQAGARVAGYALGKQLKQSRKDSFIYLKLKV